MMAANFDWLRALRRYLAAMAVGNVLWEFAHIPLYTLWVTASPTEIALAALHCAGGDMLIAMSALLAALGMFGSSRWPNINYGRVGLAAVILGLGYTVFSEWLNINVRESWSYRDLMPVIPIIGTGLSPIMQWIVLPIFALWWAAPKRGKRTS
jgi:hypothetical protein